MHSTVPLFAVAIVDILAHTTQLHPSMTIVSPTLASTQALRRSADSLPEAV